MAGGHREDLVLAHSRAAHFPEARVADFSDWFVTAEFQVDGKVMKVSSALYPHQWRHTDTPLSGLTYVCPRGPLKLAQGKGFVTQMKFPGLLPVLPNAHSGETAALRTLLDEAAAQKDRFAPDTYWDGKNLGRLATLMQSARQTGAEAASEAFRRGLRSRLETWLSASDAAGRPKTQQLFSYHANGGTVIGWPASFGSDTELNDHAFHAT